MQPKLLLVEIKISSTPVEKKIGPNLKKKNVIKKFFFFYFQKIPSFLNSFFIILLIWPVF